MAEPTATDPARNAHRLNGVIQSDLRGGAAVHTFDAGASPQEKAASAEEARDQLRSVTSTGTNEGGKEVSVDPGRPQSTTPTITISDVDRIHADERGHGVDAANSLQTATDDGHPFPGAIPHAPAAMIPNWYRVGWRAAGGFDNAPDTTQDGVADKTVLAAFFKEQYYGEWYHNAGIIFFSVVASHFLTIFNMGWSSLLILLAFCCACYSTSVARMRRRARDDIQRELVKTRLLSEAESADWINHFLDRFWLIYEPVLSSTIISSVDQILSSNTPPFLDSVRLSTFTLGTKAPRIDSVRTFPHTSEDIVMMDWNVSFTPNDVSDLTHRQAAVKVNPKIVLSIRLGTGFATAGMPILLEDITLTGLMRIKLKLMTNFPHVQIIDMTFREQPFIDYVLKPIGGEHLGFDIANIPGLSSFIREMTHATLGPMMYEPNVFTLNLEQLLSGTPLDSAIGVLQVTLQNARSLKMTKIGGGSPDPYVSVSINQRAELARTTHKHSTFNPTWHETKFILINSLMETLSMNVMDYNEHRKDSDMGSATFELAKLEEDATYESVVAPVYKDGKQRGELRFDVSFYPVLSPEQVGGEVKSVPEASAGIVRLTIHQAKDLDATKSNSGDLNPFVRVILGSTHTVIHSTQRTKHTNNPVWESSKEFLCFDRAACIIEIRVIDDRDFLVDPTVGYMTVRLEDLLGVKKGNGARDWWPLDGCKTGRLRLSVEWKPLNMAGSLQGVVHYSPPIGIIRLWMQKAVDVKNVEAAHGGKSDPYVRVLLQGTIMARTEVVNNNLNPIFDQIVYVPVHSLKEELLLECMDYQHLTRDRSLGSVELRLVDLIQRSTEDKEYPFVSTGKREYVESLQLDQTNIVKGQLHFVAEFVPAILLKDVKFDPPRNGVRQAAHKNADMVKNGDGSRHSTGSREGSLLVTVSQDDATESGDAYIPGHSNSTHIVHTDAANTTEIATTSTNGHSVGTVEEPPYEGAEMTKTELLSHQSGIVVFNLIGGRLAKKSRLEILMDDGYWPSVVTAKSNSIHARFDQVGEGFVKELDFGRVWLRLNENDDNEKEDIVAECKVDAKAFLEQALDGPANFSLRDLDDRHDSIVTIAAKYIPVKITLEQRESINNQGLLRVDLIDGKDLLAADRSGKSDPFAIFTLNDQKVFRSHVKKKTLTPDWNESFEVSVPSRVGSRFEIEVLDWNQLEHSKSLGSSAIDLESIEPFQSTTRSITLSTPTHGNKGEVRISLLFQPSIIVKTRKHTSTFSTAGRAMTQVGGLPIGAGKGLVHSVGTAGKTVRDAFKRERTSSDSKVSLEVPPNGQPGTSLDVLTGTQLSRPTDATGSDITEETSATLTTPDVAPVQPTNLERRTPDVSGMLKVTVLGAKDLVGASVGDPVKPYVVIKVGEKEQKTKHTAKTVTPEWDEMFRFIVGPETKSFTAIVVDHKTIGKDRPLGEAVVDVWNHIRPKGPPADVWLELGDGQGLLHLRLEFERGRQGSLLSFSGTPPSSPQKFATLRKSSTRDRS